MEKHPKYWLDEADYNKTPEPKDMTSEEIEQHIKDLEAVLIILYDLTDLFHDRASDERDLNMLKTANGVCDIIDFLKEIIRISQIEGANEESARVIIQFALALVGAIMNAWALSMLWGWFIVPIFKAPALSIVQAIGVALIATLLTSHLQPKTNKSKDFTDLVGKAIGYPIITVCIGWAVSGLL